MTATTCRVKESYGRPCKLCGAFHTSLSVKLFDRPTYRRTAAEILGPAPAAMRVKGGSGFTAATAAAAVRAGV